MKWTYSIKNKLLASVVLLALCLLVLLSNYLDRMHTRNVTNYITTLYEDRLVAEVYILKMTSTIYQIKEILYADVADALKSASISKLLEDFNGLYSAYMKTKLTVAEKATALELIKYIDGLEQNNMRNTHGPSEYSEKALFALGKLSTIQIEESKLILKNAEAEYATIKASSSFAFAIIIIILLVLQAMVFTSKTLMPVQKPKYPTLN
jgi:hypothetical protein